MFLLKEINELYENFSEKVYEENVLNKKNQRINSSSLFGYGRFVNHVSIGTIRRL